MLMASCGSDYVDRWLEGRWKRRRGDKEDRWCATVASATYSCLGVGNVSVICFEKERLALLNFKHSVEDPYGLLSSWVGNECCQWGGIQCDVVTGNVEHLYLETDDYYYLTGNKVSSSLAELRHLKYLDLSGNYFQGSRIPEFIGSLKQLRYLNLSDAGFEGPLPSLLQNMTSLTFLSLSGFNHSLTWNFPNLLSMIPSLSQLHWSGCGCHNTYLSSPLLNFTTLSNIQHLNLGNNPLGEIFPSFLTNMSSLRILDLSYTMLNSSLPIMPKLLELHLSGNELKQIEDVGVWRQCHLKQLSVTDNEFGRIPETLGRLANLRHLDLSENGLTGSIPESLSRLRFLEVLYLSQNHLTGLVPEFLDLDLHSNLLDGTIPVSIGQLAKLRHLFISNNSLEGVVTEAHFANLSMLKYLYTYSNTKMTFNVSRGWIPPFQLKTLYLSSCNIGNGFPQWLRHQRKLKSLELSNATLSGPLPTWLQKMPIISWLDLSHNKLSGSLTNLPNARNGHVYKPLLLLQYNLFNGSIPRSLCRRTDLQGLDLSRNMLRGKIPNCVGNLRSLITIRLSSNQLSGVIPSTISLISLLVWLNLNNNSFTGEVPQELGNLQGLEVLDLGYNKFCGNIPNWIGKNLKSLVFLRLHKNNFTGRIPQSLCKSSNLQVLDLPYNNLTGTIPRCVGNVNGMVVSHRMNESYFDLYDDKNVIQVMKGVDLEYTTTWDIVYNMDLSSNKLEGEIPVELSALSMLVGLNLSNNHLRGGIPESIGKMMNLETLDFSKNELSGRIPSSMAALNFLSHLNLSHNNFSGQIPTGNQLQTLTDPSIYSGNKGLCGPPLPNTCSNHKDPTTTTSKKKHKAAEQTRVWLFYVDIMSGFATGFWGVIGVLLFKKQWRQKLFMFAEEMVDKIYVVVMVRVAKIKRGREAA
ncbi:unnamed protein product [Lactuca saligna]|uniref:Leucine-rich repeat-containing N-terminal plant-type domain-containing protein n=1 Tax=Lactuca saligna TaxID=75948 RepID=A0AA36EKU8_LACSI|nr:unnamed protein product [Lactuca saligna]